MGFLNCLGRIVIFTPLGGVGAPILGVLGIGALTVSIMKGLQKILDD